MLEVGKMEIAELVTAWKLFVKKRAYKEWLMIFELVFLVKSTRRTVRSIILDVLLIFCSNKSECTLCGREGGWGVGNAKPLANPPHSALYSGVERTVRRVRKLSKWQVTN